MRSTENLRFLLNFQPSSFSPPFPSTSTGESQEADRGWMESSGMSGSGMMPNISRGVLGLEMPLHQSQQQQQQQQQHQPQHLRRHHQTQSQPQQLLPFPTSLSQSLHDSSANTSELLKQPAYMKPTKPQQQQPMGHVQQTVPLSPDDDDAGRQASAAASPWQRMKWTDTMVKLLIMVVFYVGDEGGGEHPSDSASSAGKAKKSSAALQQQQQQQQQKKGKWKSVSRAMMERGYNVSPQQCEDKFNDLNKRYKRVNDILGRGTACRVVENQGLLDTMDHLSPKAKEEARKLLNSKHLFFREMCAYHSTCAAAAAAAQSQASLHPTTHNLDPNSQQLCTHPAVQESLVFRPARGGETPTTSLKLTNKPVNVDDHEEQQVVKPGVEDGHDDDEEDEEDSDEDEEDDDEDRHHLRHQRGRVADRRRNEEEEEESKAFMTANSTSSGWKRQRVAGSASPPRTPPPSTEQQKLRAELAGLAGTGEQMKEWVRRRATDLEEKRVEFHRRALELERQRFKWLRFSRNKEREMEQAKLDNERLRLESERMLLMLRHKELEIMSISGAEQQQQMSIFRPGEG